MRLTSHRRVKVLGLYGEVDGITPRIDSLGTYSDFSSSELPFMDWPGHEDFQPPDGRGAPLKTWFLSTISLQGFCSIYVCIHHGSDSSQVRFTGIKVEFEHHSETAGQYHPEWEQRLWIDRSCKGLFFQQGRRENSYITHIGTSLHQTAFDSDQKTTFIGFDQVFQVHSNILLRKTDENLGFNMVVQWRQRRCPLGLRFHEDLSLGLLGGEPSGCSTFMVIYHNTNSIEKAMERLDDKHDFDFVCSYVLLRTSSKHSTFQR